MEIILNFSQTLRKSISRWPRNKSLYLIQKWQRILRVKIIFIYIMEAINDFSFICASLPSCHENYAVWAQAGFDTSRVFPFPQCPAHETSGLWDLRLTGSAPREENICVQRRNPSYHSYHKYSGDNHNQNFPGHSGYDCRQHQQCSLHFIISCEMFIWF